MLDENNGNVRASQKEINITCDAGGSSVDLLMPFNTYPDGIEVYRAERGVSRYDILKFTEKSCPEAALVAQRMQGESYVSYGYVKKTAQDADGRLFEELDRSRGKNVTYYIACTNRGNIIRPYASLRKVSIPEGGGIEDLAAYRYSKDVLFDGELEKLENTVGQFGAASIVEIAALAKTPQCSPFASFELIRILITEAIRESKPLKWLMTLVSPAFEELSSIFGLRTIRPIGSKVEIDVGDERISSELRLIPAVVVPKSCLASILHSISEKIADNGEMPGFEIADIKRMFFGFNFIKAHLSRKEQIALISKNDLKKLKRIEEIVS